MFTCICFILNCLYWVLEVFIVISVLFCHILFPEIIGEVNFSVQTMSHSEILGIIHEVFFILSHDVEVLGTVFVNLSICMPIVALKGFIECLARGPSNIIENSTSWYPKIIILIERVFLTHHVFSCRSSLELISFEKCLVEYFFVSGKAKVVGKGCFFSVATFGEFCKRPLCENLHKFTD